MYPQKEWSPRHATSALECFVHKCGCQGKTGRVPEKTKKVRCTGCHVHVTMSMVDTHPCGSGETVAAWQVTRPWTTSRAEPLRFRPAQPHNPTKCTFNHSDGHLKPPLQTAAQNPNHLTPCTAKRCSQTRNRCMVPCGGITSPTYQCKTRGVRGCQVGS